MTELTFERLRELLDYESDTGRLIWKVTRSGMALKGSEAGSIHHGGHRALWIDGRIYLAHRVIFFWMEGRWPSNHMDHINRVRHDNRWCNLREATRSQNMANKVVPRRKHDLPRGVNRWGNKYRAMLIHNKKRHYLGLHSTPEEADAAYRKKAAEIWGEYALRE